jgi:hypothetical protein
MKCILQFLDRLGPTVARHRRRRPRRGRRGRQHHRIVPGGTLDLDRLHRTGGDPGVGPSHLTPEQIPNPRVRVTPRPPSPPLHHWPTGRQNPQIWLTLRGVTGNRLVPSMAWARAHTRLPNRYSHHQVRGKEKKDSPKRKKMAQSWSLL